MLSLPQRKNWPRWAILATLAAMVLVLRWEGRSWFCRCGNIQIWIADAQSSHTSQHLLDPYSFSHIQHGLVLFFIVGWLARRWHWKAQFWLTLLIEAGWEMLENTPMIIDRYRQTTSSLGYTGDSIVNSVGDLLSCAVGFLLARWLGGRATLVLFLAIEALMLVTIRDSLLLNILMLIYPIQIIKYWQMG